MEALHGVPVRRPPPADYTAPGRQALPELVVHREVDDGVHAAVRHGHGVDGPEELADVLPAQQVWEVVSRQLEDVVRQPGQGVGGHTDHHHDHDLREEDSMVRDWWKICCGVQRSP